LTLNVGLHGDYGKSICRAKKWKPVPTSYTTYLGSKSEIIIPNLLEDDSSGNSWSTGCGDAPTLTQTFNPEEASREYSS
jgi:hypothetical protein